MNNKMFRMLFIVSVASIFLYLIYYCWFLPGMLAGLNGNSGGIEESKKLGVFVAEYTVEGDSIDIGNGHKIIPGEIWVENCWSYGKKGMNDAVKWSNNEHANYWLFIEIPTKDWPYIDSNYFCYNTRFSLMVNEEHSFGMRGVNNKNYFHGTYVMNPSQIIEIKVIEKTDSQEVDYIPQKWKKPKLVSIIRLIKKNQYDYIPRQ